MKELKHTKGKMHSKEHHIYCEGKSFPIGQSFLMSVALKPDGTLEEDLESIANAKLWASAQELLGACLMAYFALTSGSEVGKEQAIKQLDRAIKKATE